MHFAVIHHGPIYLIFQLPIRRAQLETTNNASDNENAEATNSRGGFSIDARGFLLEKKENEKFWRMER